MDGRLLKKRRLKRGKPPPPCVPPADTSFAEAERAVEELFREHAREHARGQVTPSKQEVSPFRAHSDSGGSGGTDKQQPVLATVRAVMRAALATAASRAASGGPARSSPHAARKCPGRVGKRPMRRVPRAAAAATRFWRSGVGALARAGGGRPMVPGVDYGLANPGGSWSRSEGFAAGEGELFTVEDVLATHVVDGCAFYLVRWQGSDPATGLPYNDSWQGEQDIDDVDDPEWGYMRRERDYFVWVTQDNDTMVEVMRDIQTNFGEHHRTMPGLCLAPAITTTTTTPTTTTTTITHAHTLPPTHTLTHAYTIPLTHSHTHTHKHVARCAGARSTCAPVHPPVHRMLIGALACTPVLRCSGAPVLRPVGLTGLAVPSQPSTSTSGRRASGTGGCTPRSWGWTG